MKSHLNDDLTAYLRGELPRDEKRQVSDHLIDCLECRQEFKELKEVQEALNGFPEIPPSDGFLSRVTQKADEIALAETRADLVLEEMAEMTVRPAAPLFPWVVMGLFVLLLGGGAIIYAEFLQSSPSEVSVSVTDVSQEFAPQAETVAAPNTLPRRWSSPDREELAKEFQQEVEWGKAHKENDVFTETPWLEETRTVMEFPLEPTPFLDLPQVPPLPRENLPPPPLHKITTVEAVGDYTRSEIESPPAWVGEILQGSLSEGASLGTNFFLLGQLAQGAPHLLTPPQHQQLNFALESMSLETGDWNSVTDLARATYHLAALVKRGREGLRPTLSQACHRLKREQNPDGGWAHTFKPARDPSNTLTTAYATLALTDAREIGVKLSAHLVSRGRHFLYRLTDPRGAECGFYARGDQVEPHLCSVFAMAVRLSHPKVNAKRLPRSVQRARDWVLMGVVRQVARLEKGEALDDDLLEAIHRFLEESEALEEWPEILRGLPEHSYFYQAPSLRSDQGSVSRRLLMRLYQKH